MACIFCQIAAGEVPSDIVYQDEALTAFRDINPQASVHILIVPNKHIPSVAEICDEDGRLLVKAFCLANDLAASEGIAQRGYRLVINHGADGGQSVSHLHIHLLGGRQMSWPPG